MNLVWQVALREIKERGRSKAYLLISMFTLLLVAGLILVPQLLGGGSEEYRIGLVGEGNEAIVDTALRLANANDEPDAQPSVVIATTSYDSRESAISGLEADEIEAVLVDGQEVVTETTGFSGSGLVDLLQRGAATVDLERLVAEEGQTAEQVIEVMTSDPLRTVTTSGEEADESRAVVAYAGLLLLYLAILLYGTWILTGVTEEKSNRVVEVLLSTLRPWQLLGGKILGIGILGIIQFLVTVGVGITALRLGGGIDIPQIDPISVVNLVVWFVLGFFLFAFMFGAAGSLASRSEDAQNVALPMSLVAVAGFFVSISALNAPEGTAALVGTFVPVTAPFVVPVRVALQAIPLWQYSLSVLLTIALAIALVYVGGRIYAGALLRFGGVTGVREAWRSATE